MRSQTLVKTYAQGLINSAKDEKEFKVLCHNLQSFYDLFSLREGLKDALTSHFLSPGKKIEIAKEVLTIASFEEKVIRFILLLIENGRLAILPDILAFLPILWNEENGISTFEISSVLPLTEDQKKKLEEKLCDLEARPVSLNFKLDPSLIGGLSIRKGNIIYDISVRGSLERIREIISEE